MDQYKFVKAWLAGILIFVAISESPFVIFGEYAAYFWMMWNSPLAGVVEERFGLGPGTWVKHALVLLVNAVVWGGVLGVIIHGVRKGVERKKPTE